MLRLRGYGYDDTRAPTLEGMLQWDRYRRFVGRRIHSRLRQGKPDWRKGYKCGRERPARGRSAASSSRRDEHGRALGESAAGRDDSVAVAWRLQRGGAVALAACGSSTTVARLTGARHNDGHGKRTGAGAGIPRSQ